MQENLSVDLTQRKYEGWGELFGHPSLSLNVYVRFVGLLKLPNGLGFFLFLTSLFLNRM